MPTPTPPPAVSAVAELAAELARLNGEHARVLNDLGSRKVRTLPEAIAVAVLALSLPPEQGHPLAIRVCRFVRRLEAEAGQ